MIFIVIMNSVLVTGNPARISESCSLLNNLNCLHLELETNFINVFQSFSFLFYSSRDQLYNAKIMGKEVIVKLFGIMES
jgi:hypothetical protein